MIDDRFTQKAREVWKECSDYWGLIGDNTNPEGNIEEIIEIVAQALREEAERVEKLWPSETECEKARWEELKKFFSGDPYGHSWTACYNWLKEKIFGGKK